MTSFEPLGRLLDQRRQDVVQADSIAGDYYVYRDSFPLGDMGEAVVTVRFSCRFVEEPFFVGSISMGDNAQIVPGQFPVGSAILGGWDLGVRGLSGDRFYDGATVLVVVTGSPNNKPILKVRFEGRALTGPAGRSIS